jgi:hypothetical protein
MPKLSLTLSFALAILATAGLRAKEMVLDEGVRQFIRAYCIKCHGPDEDKSDRTFHKLAQRKNDQWVVNLADPKKTDLLHDVLDQLNLGDMPPKKKDVKQPKPVEVRQTIAWLTKALLDAERDKGPKETVLRRLNRREFGNSIRDLLGLENLPFDLTANFPDDEEVHGFTNIGDALNLSDRHLDAYLGAADRYLRMAFRFDEPEKARTTVIEPHRWGYPDRVKTTPWMYRIHQKNKYLDFAAGKKQLSEHFDLGTFPHGWYSHTGGIKTPGYYKIMLTAEAVRRLTHPYDPKMIPTDLSQPMQLSIFVSRGKKGMASDSLKSRSKIGLWDLRDHQPKKYEVAAWLDKGDAPFLNWDNGPGPSDYWMRDICKKYHTDIEFRGKQGSHAWHVVGKDLVPGRIVSDVWKGPVVRIHDFRIYGPISYTYQTKAQQVFLDGKRDLSKIDLATAFSRFARRAFRRPLSKPEIEPYLEIERHARQKLGRTRENAFFLALKAMLVSPDFLYLKEEKSADNRLTSFELANRLSYFLWSSLPDHELFQLAKEGKLKDRAILKNQVIRLLEDPRSQDFVEGFSEAWLRLDKLGSMPPDSLKFHEYYRYGLEDAMLEETHRFISHALSKNVPLTDFIHSDYGFLNQDLARHYGIKGVEGVHFRKVSFPKNGIRGGLLGQASILTLTANGIDTSPVVRGIWVLESLLGTPPAPPPPDVEPIDPDVRGAKSMKQLLEKHRSVEACADCHAKIDPFGFPLEFFDPIGGYRPTYYRSRYWRRSQLTTVFFPSFPIDGSASLPTGERFDDPMSLKKALLGKSDLLAKNLVKKLLTYGAGRPMNLRDEGEIQKIATISNRPGSGFRDLILEIATSKIFTHR